MVTTNRLVFINNQVQTYGLWGMQQILPERSKTLLFLNFHTYSFNLLVIVKQATLKDRTRYNRITKLKYRTDIIIV